MTVRIDEYGPEWAHGIIEDLDTGYTGGEAVARAAESLRNKAIEAEQRADHAGKLALVNGQMIGHLLGAEDRCRQYREEEAEAKRHAADLRLQAAQVATLKGEYIAIARLIR